MMEPIFLMDMFPQYDPPEHLLLRVCGLTIVTADINAPERSVSMQLSCDEYIPFRDLNEMARDICEIYGLRHLSMHMHYPAAQLHAMPDEDLMALFVRETSMNRGSLAVGVGWL